ncbi:MAG: hypothetical protein D6729_07825 [Deltaproteobacteria bacterium]|nr:MAG: hypothetical protein D6729_07825 [Deltaproteobacteria bacterium]
MHTTDRNGGGPGAARPGAPYPGVRKPRRWRRRPAHGAGRLPCVLAAILLTALLGSAACPAQRRPPPKSTARPPKPAGARAWVIARRDQIPRGPAAGAEVGDIVIENAHAYFVVEGPGAGQGFAQTGGNLIDAAHKESAGDLLNQSFLYLDDTFQRLAAYETVEIVEAGGPGETAVVRSRGHDNRAPEIRIETEYRLAPDAVHLEIVTRFENTGEATVEGYELGDAIQWGRTQHWAPGYGLKIAGKTVDVEWLAGIGPGSSYGWASPDGPLNVISGASWSDPIVKTVDLAPGGTATFRRALVVGLGDVASLLPTLLAIRGLPSGTVRVLVREAGSERPVAESAVELRREDGTPYATAAVKAAGRATVKVPPGRYRVAARIPGRTHIEAIPVEVEAGQTHEAVLHVTPQGRLSVRVRERVQEKETPSLRAVPCRVTLHGLGETPDPDLGPNYRAEGAGRFVFLRDGTTTLALAPGRYRVYASRGLEYDLPHVDVEVRAGATAEADLVLERVVDTRGWISADFHQHAIHSFDSAVTLEDRVLANAAEGVEILVSSDHDYVTDFDPVIDRMGLRAWLDAFPGVEVTTSTVGHFNCYPFPVDPAARQNGAPPSEGHTPAEIFDACRKAPGERIVQVNHPRAGASGYFDLTGFDPAHGTVIRDRIRHPRAVYDAHYDAIEVFNGKRVNTAMQVMRDWFALLDAGQRYTATGNSDTHTLTHDNAGYPRNFLKVEDDTPGAVDAATLVDVVKRRRAVVVSNGPLVFLSSGKTGVGGTVRASAGEAVPVRVQVRAAPWVRFDTVELIQNGEVVRTLSVDPADRRVARVDVTWKLSFSRSGWVVAVARGEAPLAPVVVGRDDAAVTALGFTNPIWVEVDTSP